MRNTTTSLASDEELTNCLTHVGGLMFAVVGAAVLFSAVAENVNEPLRLGCWVYALTLIAVYATSALSHSFKDPARRHLFRRLDQGVIFLFIAANFTPIAIVYLDGLTQWLLLAFMWTLALIGFGTKVFWGYRVESMAVTHYLALGWLPLTATVPILRALSTGGIIWFLAGGLCYTIGTIFLTLDTRVRYFHAVWHLSVIAGSYCHFLVVVDYAIPLES